MFLLLELSKQTINDPQCGTQANQLITTLYSRILNRADARMASILPRRVGRRPRRSPIPAALYSPFPPAMVAVLLYLALLLLLAGGPPSSSQGLGVGVAAAALPLDDGAGGGAGPFVPPDAAAVDDAAGGLNKPTNGTSAGGALGCWCGSASNGDDSIDHLLY